jgi:hypothetical protein
MYPPKPLSPSAPKAPVAAPVAAPAAAAAAPAGPTAAQLRQAEIDKQMAAGTTYAQGQLGKLGFPDTYGLMEGFNKAMGEAAGNVPATAAGGDIKKYFNPESYWTNAVNTATGEQRGKLNLGYSNVTTPGWQQGQYGFADTADDAILNAILGGQKGEASNALQAQLQRGQMSQGAYDYALGKLSEAEKSGMSTLQGLGGGVLGGYRGQLGGIADQYGQAISGYQLGQNLSIDDLKNQLTNKRTALGGMMEGDILNALGGTRLFNIDALAAQAGQAAGTSNTPLAQSFQSQANNALVDPYRTTGTTGIF